MTYLASQVGFEFVKMGIVEKNYLTQMKLQKLVFFAHGLSLAQDFGPLIQEEFQAWKYGPVIPALYHDYKFYGSSPIDSTDWIESVNFEGFFDVNFDKKAKDTIDFTWSKLKTIDAISLSAWTHKQGSPWQKHFKNGIPDVVIPNEDIKMYFKETFLKKQNS